MSMASPELVVAALVDAVVAVHEASLTNHKEKLLNSSRVRMGRNPAVASVFERNLAQNLSKLWEDCYFLVDYPISLYEGGKSLRTVIYPDILVLKDYDPEKRGAAARVVGILDLKIDLGYLDLDYFEEDGKFDTRERKIRRATECQWNYIAGGYSGKEKAENKIRGKQRAAMDPGQAGFLRVCIVLTRNNDHDRSEAFEAAMQRNGYRVAFLLGDSIHYNDGESHERPDFERQVRASGAADMLVRS